VSERVNVEKEFIGACLDMQWRDPQEGMERLLGALSWWLDTKGENPAALAISALRNDFEFNTSAAKALEHVFQSTDRVSVEDLLEEWTRLQEKDESGE